MKNKKDEKRETAPEEVVAELVVTEEDYQEGLRRGWTDDDMPKPGRYKFRRANFIERFPGLKEEIEKVRAKSRRVEEPKTEGEAFDGRAS
jgi:hypothetical protein